TIVTQEFDDASVIHLDGFASLTYNAPPFLGADFTVTSDGLGTMRLDGTAGPTVLQPIIGVATLEFTNITNVTFAIPSGATNDTLTIDNSLGGYELGLQSLTVNLGPGNDTLRFIGSIDIPGGGTIAYEGGTGIDTISVDDDTNW